MGYACGRQVHCANRQASKPPVCAVLVKFGKSALDDAVKGETLAISDSYAFASGRVRVLVFQALQYSGDGPALHDHREEHDGVSRR